jgi:processed acidic surface protein
MKRIIQVFVLGIILFAFNAVPAHAAISEEELDQYLKDIGWSKSELQEYFDYFELSLVQFATIEELQAELGTPLTEENLTQLLANYNMTKEELDELFASFGDSVEDYLIYEELDASIDFYLNHDEYMKEAEDFLANVGLSQDEVDQLFNHLMALDETELEQRMEEVAAKLEPFATLDPNAELTEAQKNELASVWTEMMNLIGLNPNYHLVDANGVATPVSFQELLAINELGGKSLVLELYDLEGNLLLDMQLSEDMLTSDYLFQAANQLVDVGDLAGELTTIKHDTIPKTASPYLVNMLLGLLTIIGGFIIFQKARKREHV